MAIDVKVILDWVNLIAYVLIFLAVWNFINALFGGALSNLAGKIPGFGNSKDKDERKPSKDEEDGKPKKSEEPKGELNESAPTNLGFTVIDLEGFPLQGANIIVKGKVGKKDKTYEFYTTTDGQAPARPVASGPVVIEVRHRNKNFFDTTLFWGPFGREATTTRKIPWFNRGRTEMATNCVLDPSKDNSNIILVVNTRRNWRPHIRGIVDKPDGKYANGQITYHER
jgi:hypothetical protein